MVDGVFTAEDCTATPTEIRRLRERIATLVGQLKQSHQEACDVVVYRERNAALERKLASLDWSRITPENLPRIDDDEVLRECPGRPSIIERCCQFMEYEAWSRYRYTHRRPVNLPNPPEHPAPETGEDGK